MDLFLPKVSRSNLVADKKRKVTSLLSGMLFANIQVPFETYSGVIPDHPGVIR